MPPGPLLPFPHLFVLPSLKNPIPTPPTNLPLLTAFYPQILRNTQKERGDSDPELVPNPNANVVNLEHVLPQNASSSWSHIPLDEQVLLLKRIGNMALMKSKLNAKAANDSFASKRAFYAKSEFRLTKQLAAGNTWNRRRVERRQEDLADLAVKTWPLR